VESYGFIDGSEYAASLDAWQQEGSSNTPWSQFYARICVVNFDLYIRFT